MQVFYLKGKGITLLYLLISRAIISYIKLYQATLS